MLQSNFTFIDLFCGAGGLSLGFTNAGFRCIRALDHDKLAIATHNSNLHESASVAEITESIELKYADVIVGGPPCQGFSSAGMRRQDDQRNTLVRVFAELIVSQKPLAFVFENVEGVSDR